MDGDRNDLVLQGRMSTNRGTPLSYAVERGHEPVVKLLSMQNSNNPRSQSEDLDAATNDKVGGKQNPRTDDRSHNPEAMQTGLATDSGYLFAIHDKFEHVQNARAEDHTQSTGNIQSRLPLNEESESATNNTSEGAQSPKDVESDDVKTAYSDPPSLLALHKDLSNLKMSTPTPTIQPDTSVQRAIEDFQRISAMSATEAVIETPSLQLTTSQIISGITYGAVTGGAAISTAITARRAANIAERNANIADRNADIADRNARAAELNAATAAAKLEFDQQQGLNKKNHSVLGAEIATQENTELENVDNLPGPNGVVSNKFSGSKTPMSKLRRTSNIPICISRDRKRRQKENAIAYARITKLQESMRKRRLSTSSKAYGPNMARLKTEQAERAGKEREYNLAIARLRAEHSYGCDGPSSSTSGEDRNSGLSSGSGPEDEATPALHLLDVQENEMRTSQDREHLDSFSVGSISSDQGHSNDGDEGPTSDIQIQEGLEDQPKANEREHYDIFSVDSTLSGQGVSNTGGEGLISNDIQLQDFSSPER
jgi:hypothetical protein